MPGESSPRCSGVIGIGPRLKPLHYRHSLFCRYDGVCGTLSGQIWPSIRCDLRRHHAGSGPARFGAGSFAAGDGLDLWRRRRIGDWSGLLSDNAASHQMVSARPQGCHHRHCGQRRGVGGGLYLSPHPIPPGQDDHFDDICLAGRWHSGSGAAAGAAFEKPARTAGGGRLVRAEACRAG